MSRGELTAVALNNMEHRKGAVVEVSLPGRDMGVSCGQ